MGFDARESQAEEALARWLEWLVGKGSDSASQVVFIQCDNLRNVSHGWFVQAVLFARQ